MSLHSKAGKISGEKLHDKVLQGTIAKGRNRPPDVGLALTAIWRVAPIPPIATGGPFPNQSPSLPTFPSLFPQPPWLFLQCSTKVRPRLVWGRGPSVVRGGGGGPSKRHLGPDPHLGVLKKSAPSKTGDFLSKIEVSGWDFSPLPLRSRLSEELQSLPSRTYPSGPDPPPRPSRRT